MPMWQVSWVRNWNAAVWGFLSSTELQLHLGHCTEHLTLSVLNAKSSMPNFDFFKNLFNVNKIWPNKRTSYNTLKSCSVFVLDKAEEWRETKQIHWSQRSIMRTKHDKAHTAWDKARHRGCYTISTWCFCHPRCIIMWLLSCALLQIMLS